MAPQLTIQPRNFSADDPGGWDALIDTARAADTAGVDRIILSDHVVMGENLDAYGDPKKGGAAGGKQPTGPDGHWLEPLTTLSFLAGQTESVRLGTNILIAALRRPVVLAKSASTLAVLSGGRLDLGVGVGWQAEEYTAAGLDFSARGRQLDHTLEVCQSLWSDPRVSYQSDELAFDDIHMMPKPPGGAVPVWVSGTVNPRAMKRLARFGDGWIPWGPAVADPVGAIAAMREMVGGFDRDPSDIQVTAYLKTAADDAGVVDFAATMGSAEALLEAGVTDCKVTLPIPTGREAATDYLSTAVAAFRAATA